jgi:hypothetical protein
MDKAEFELVAALVAYSRLNSKDRSWLDRQRPEAAEGPLAERLPRLEELIELRAVQVEIAELARLGITA